MPGAQHGPDGRWLIEGDTSWRFVSRLQGDTSQIAGAAECDASPVASAHHHQAARPLSAPHVLHQMVPVCRAATGWASHDSFPHCAAIQQYQDSPATELAGRTHTCPELPLHCNACVWSSTHSDCRCWLLMQVKVGRPDRGAKLPRGDTKDKHTDKLIVCQRAPSDWAALHCILLGTAPCPASLLSKALMTGWHCRYSAAPACCQHVTPARIGICKVPRRL